MTDHLHPILGNNVRDFILGGKALFTIENCETGKRFTFKVRQKTNPDGTLTPHFVSVLTGADNTKNYSYIGCIFGNNVFRWGRQKSRLVENDIRVKAFAWVFANSENLPQNIVVYHHGHCGRCGRLLTTPDSIRQGLGPICGNR